MINAGFAFVRRDGLQWASYRLNALMQVGAVLLTVALLYFVGQTLGGHAPGLTLPGGASYAAYLFTGIAFADAWGIGFNFPRMLRDAQTTGTLEVMLMSRFGVFQILVLSILFPVLQSFIRLLVYSAFAIFVFGLWHNANALAAVTVFILALLTLGCIGLLSAAITLVVKQGDPLFAIYSLLNVGLAGVFFPRGVLPAWVQDLSLALPLTHALEGIRRALAGASVVQIAPQLLALAAMLAVCLPFTIWALRWAVTRAKQDGSLVQY